MTQYWKRPLQAHKFMPSFETTFRPPISVFGVSRQYFNRKVDSASILLNCKFFHDGHFPAVFKSRQAFPFQQFDTITIDYVINLSEVHAEGNCVWIGSKLWVAG